MIVIDTKNAHTALPVAIHTLLVGGVRRESRVGDVLVSRDPVTTMYRDPLNKVVFWPERDANPYFHLMEALWMLGGRSDAAWISKFNKNIARFAQDHGYFHGGYGARWRVWFVFDQIDTVVANLKDRPTCRRQILTMWDPYEDLKRVDEADLLRDVPCNTQVHLQINPEGRLDMTVFCRSNDVVWGCYGSDSVTFGFLIEYLAARIGVPAGRYWQVSDNWHGYAGVVEPLFGLVSRMNDPDPYDKVENFPLISDASTFDSDLKMFLEEGDRGMGYKNRFFRRVALPLLASWNEFKSSGPDRHRRALERLDECGAQDWRRACREWIQRRKARCSKKT